MKDTIKYIGDLFSHRYNPVVHDGGCYGPDLSQEKEALTKIDVTIKFRNPSESYPNYYQSNFRLKFDLDKDGSETSGYHPSTALYDVYGEGFYGLSKEINKKLAESFPNQSVSLETMVHTEKSQEEDISLFEDEIFASIALSTTKKVIDENLI